MQLIYEMYERERVKVREMRGGQGGKYSGYTDGQIDTVDSHFLCALHYQLHNHAFHTFHSGPHYHGTHPTGCLISQRAFAY